MEEEPEPFNIVAMEAETHNSPLLAFPSDIFVDATVTRANTLSISSIIYNYSYIIAT